MPASVLIQQVRRARLIKRTLGTRVAAEYMRNRGYDVSVACLVLARN